MLRLEPAPGPHPGPALQDEVGQVAVVVVHHPEQRVPANNFLNFQVNLCLFANIKLSTLFIVMWGYLLTPHRASQAWQSRDAESQ